MIIHHRIVTFPKFLKQLSVPDVKNALVRANTEISLDILTNKTETEYCRRNNGSDFPYYKKNYKTNIKI